MGIFSPNFQREGAGVEKNEPSKEGLSLFFDLFISRFWDLMKLNIIFIIYCIPIITIAPAFGALTSITISIVRRKPILFMLKDFHTAFKSNWKQSFICGFLCCFLFSILYYASVFYYKLSQENPILYAIFFLCIFMMFLLLFAWIYIFPILTTISLSIKDIFKNALSLSIVCLKHTLLGSFAYGLILIGTIIYLPLVFPLIFIFTFSLLSFISSFTSWYGINKYLTKD